ncbi:hypothetical protein D9M68_679040 [compost metagenome]|uniref:Uncharacterized protein n=1 Tax=Achromobacter agilis TaxID=1353888 RepID=A0A446CB80_9BURK|nr:hypothetical protein AGI3411_01964 [Achromobacter agilis]
MRATIQICSGCFIPLWKGKQFVANFASFDSASDIIEQFSAIREPPTAQVANEKSIGEVGYLSLHDPQVEYLALFISNEQMTWASIDAVDAPR